MNNKGKIDKIKGITLISLTITIIILLILAGVTLNLVMGEEGVIKRAINARDVHSVQEALEKIKLAVLSAQIAGVGEIEENELKNDLKRYFGNDYKGANVPKGYFVDTRSNVDTGLVITDSVDAEGYSTGNEWVWVPVNSAVGNDDYYYEGKGRMRYSGKDVEYTRYSKNYNFTTNTETGETTRTIRASRQSSGALGEPMLVSWGEFGEYYYLDYIHKRGTCNTFDNTTDVGNQYVKDYNDMTNSVDKYKGFYIGRYELADVNGVAKIQPGKSMTEKNWYYFYNTCMDFSKENSVSGMIYGNLWDATMQWLLTSNYYVGDGPESGYGNTNAQNVFIEKNNTLIIIKQKGREYVMQTGQTSYTISNNIYDLSGNCFDWTQEVSGENIRATRGGYYRCGGSDFQASTSSRLGDSYPVRGDVNKTTRAHFFIK